MESLRLLLTDEIESEVDDADDEVEEEEEEFLLRRLVFELPVSLGLLLARVSASFFFLGPNGGWTWSKSSSLRWRSEESEICSVKGLEDTVVGRLSTSWTELVLVVAPATTFGTKWTLETSLVSSMATPRMLPCSSTTLNE